MALEASLAPAASSLAVVAASAGEPRAVPVVLKAGRHTGAAGSKVVCARPAAVPDGATPVLGAPEQAEGADRARASDGGHEPELEPPEERAAVEHAEGADRASAAEEGHEPELEPPEERAAAEHALWFGCASAAEEGHEPELDPPEERAAAEHALWFGCASAAEPAGAGGGQEEEEREAGVEEEEEEADEEDEDKAEEVCERGKAAGDCRAEDGRGCWGAAGGERSVVRPPGCQTKNLAMLALGLFGSTAAWAYFFLNQSGCGSTIGRLGPPKSGPTLR